MKFLNGAELAGYIKERQAQVVADLRETRGLSPRLAIVLTNDHPASATYVRLKQRYGEEILVEVVIEHTTLQEAPAVIARHSRDEQTHGIIVQLPLDDPTRTDEIVGEIDPTKDVDALHSSAFFDPATPTAILWLLAGYNVDVRSKKVLVIGQGRLVGAPLVQMLRQSDIAVTIADKGDDVTAACRDAEVIITGTGQPGLLTSEMIPRGAVVVDAGVASEGGKLVGDVAPDVYVTRDDLTITPQRGGVGPLTVCALFENVIRAMQRVTQSS